MARKYGRLAPYLVPGDGKAGDWVRETSADMLGVTDGGDLSAVATRNPEERRRYIGDPARYLAEICGYKLSRQQKRFCREFVEQPEMILFSGNGTGKSFLIGALADYYVDAEAAALGDDGREVGATVVLVGPVEATLKGNTWKYILMAANAAERRGYKMPGRRGDVNSIWWHVPGRPGWGITAKLSPPREGERQAHSAAGSHAEKQIWIYEEGPGVRQVMWDTGENACVGSQDKRLAVGNPYESKGPFYFYATGGSWHVTKWSSLDHENVLERRDVFPGAVSHIKLEKGIRADCTRLGPFPKLRPDPFKHQFVYALPDEDMEDKLGPREDGFPGHPDAELSVFQANEKFAARYLGEFPSTAAGALLFPPALWDERVAVWKEVYPRAVEAGIMQERLGVDPARQGNDDATFCTSSGPPGPVLLKRYLEALERRDSEALKMLLLQPIITSPIGVLAKGDGYDMAVELHGLFPNKKKPRWIADAINEGYSLIDFGKRIFGHDVLEVQFGANPPTRRLHESSPYFDNNRSMLYWYASWLLRLGLVLPPDDPKLKEEATTIWYESRVVYVDGDKQQAVSLPLKKEHSKLLPGGRSPDSLDAWVLSLYDRTVTNPHTWLGIS